MLTINNLAVSFQTRRGEITAVKNLSLTLDKGEVLGIVGESGSGKSVTSYAILRVLDKGGKISAGDIHYSGIDLCEISEREIRDIRGREISMIFQNPRAALNPIRQVGKQLEDVLKRHAQASNQDAKAKAIEALESVKIRDAESRYHAYPIRDLIRARNMSSILITHDLGLASQYCDRIMVMKDGEIVEEGIPSKLFTKPSHPYTRKLVNATPRPDDSVRCLLADEIKSPEPQYAITEEVLLDVKSLSKIFKGKNGDVHAVKDISFQILKGQSLGLVGESGSGKSTTAEMLVRLIDPSSGEIQFEGENLSTIPSKVFATHLRRRDIQMVFQDATDSLNPRHTAQDTISEPLRRLAKMRGKTLIIRVKELARLVGLPEHLLHRFPHQLSGGQKARVGIARAIALNPKLLILDEPTAALDVSIQAIVLNLLADLREKLGMSYLFVSHDLHVVKLLCDKVIVMRNGGIVEAGDCEDIMSAPRHEYTKELLAAAPAPPKRKDVTELA